MVLRYDTKNTIKKKKTKKEKAIDKLDFHPRLKTCPSKDTSKKVRKDSLKNGRKYLKSMYIKNSFNSITKRQHNLKMGKGSE